MRRCLLVSILLLVVGTAFLSDSPSTVDAATPPIRYRLGQADP